MKMISVLNGYKDHILEWIIDAQKSNEDNNPVIILDKETFQKFH